MTRHYRTRGIHGRQSPSEEEHAHFLEDREPCGISDSHRSRRIPCVASLDAPIVSEVRPRVNKVDQVSSTTYVVLASMRRGRKQGKSNHIIANCVPHKFGD